MGVDLFLPGLVNAFVIILPLSCFCHRFVLVLLFCLRPHIQSSSNTALGTPAKLLAHIQKVFDRSLSASPLPCLVFSLPVSFLSFSLVEVLVFVFSCPFCHVLSHVIFIL